MNGRFRIFWDLFSYDDMKLVSKQTQLYKGNLLWELDHEKIIRDKLINLNKRWVTSCNFYNNSFWKPFIFVWNFKLISWKQAGIIILTTSKQKISISLAIIVTKGYLHVILSLTFFYFSISFALFTQKCLKNRFILSSRFIFEENWPQSSCSFSFEDISAFQTRIGLPSFLKSYHLLNWIFISRFFFACFLCDPVDNLFLLNQRFPFVRTPFKFCRFFIIHTWSSAYKNGTAIVTIFNLHKTQNKYVGISTYEALDRQVSKLSFGMSCNLIVFAFDQMKDNVWCESILSFFIAKPFSACLVPALYDTAFVADNTVRAGMSWYVFLNWLCGAFVWLVIRVLLWLLMKHRLN